MIKSDKDTITAVGTKPGESAIGIVRISGEKAIKIAEKIFRSNSGKKVFEIESFSMALGQIVDERGAIIDQVILSVMRSPKSYTREDVIEINCHGGIAPTEKVLSLCLCNGARMAEPGEFTKRAFLNGRIDLTQAEAVIEIVRAKTEQAMKIAANNLKGGLKEKIQEIRAGLLDVIIELEAAIDFTEEDLETVSYDVLKKEIDNLFKKIRTLVEDEKRGEIVKNGVKVSIVGKPNVGKSSLLNAIARKEKAIVTHIPGTTRDAVEEILYVGGIPLILIDTAGIRKTKNIIEKIGVKRSLDYIEESDLIIVVIDGSAITTPEDMEIIGKVKYKKSILCLNKIDLAKKVDSKIFAKENGFKTAVEVSAKKGTGIPSLEIEIKKAVLGSNEIDIENIIIINQRHKKILTDTMVILRNALKAMGLKMSEEFPAADLRDAYELMGEITGETMHEEILNGIFSKFCIGK